MGGGGHAPKWKRKKGAQLHRRATWRGVEGWGSGADNVVGAAVEAGDNRCDAVTWTGAVEGGGVRVRGLAIGPVAGGGPR
jgi:hypothetical protein